MVASGGDVTRFSPAEPEELLEGLGAAVDAPGGGLTMRYAAVVATAVRAAPG